MEKSVNFLVVIICHLFVIGLSLLFFVNTANAKEFPQRMSFAISGGASMGAYEAGINWAALRILRYETERDDPVLRGRYRPFEASSVAGASAGGINAVLSAMAWCVRPESKGGFPNNINDNVFRNLWFVPDINNLLPHDPQSPLYIEGDAVLSRNSLIKAAEKLRELWNKPIFRQGCRVPLGVTVTRVQPEQLRVGDIAVKNQRFTIPFELRVVDDGRVRFFFDPTDYPAVEDYSMILLPNRRGQPKNQIDDQSIIDAVLTSAAFPVGFGRKRLKYCRLLAHYHENDLAEPTEEETNKQQLICPRGYELSETIFADGGLFDNLPIGLARTLAEKHKSALNNPYPVTYVYIDPNRLRYEVPKKKQFELCHQEDPPPACNEMEHSFGSESQLLFGALGTARSYELYRELTSETWSQNLSLLSYELAERMEVDNPELECKDALPLFAKKISCAESLRKSGRLLEISYDRLEAPITPPFSVKKLRGKGLVSHCRESDFKPEMPVESECYIGYRKFRGYLADVLKAVIKYIPSQSVNLERRIHNAQLSLHNDRIIRVTSRGGPITGELLGAFAAFLDLKFRKYDYYVGVYDAVIIVSQNVCGHHYSFKQQAKEYQQCKDSMVEWLFRDLGIFDDPKGRYVFALLAKWEFGEKGLLSFAYNPMPAENKNMRIIHEGLIKAHTLAWERAQGLQRSSGEMAFFNFLKSQGFKPTPAEDGSSPLLADIMNDPELWAYELTRRFTNRLIYLEEEADRIFAEREPDPDKRPDSWGALLGGSSYVLRSATYRYPSFDFSPSTAPKKWFWRYVIPYEIAFDLAEGDIQLVWQPTWALSKHDLLGIRGSYAFAEGFIGSSSHTTRENYFAFGLNYSRLTGGGIISSWGLTPSYFRTVRTPEDGGRDSFGGDVHVSILANKVRFALGARDFEGVRDSWYLLVGLTDVPGMIYWFTR